MVQDVLASRMEKIWTMADIALQQGQVHAKSSAIKAVEFLGLSFTFEEEQLVRIKGPHLDVRVLVPVMTMNFNENIVAFPASKTGLHFDIGGDADLDKWYGQCVGQDRAFTVTARKKAA